MSPETASQAEFEDFILGVWLSGMASGAATVMIEKVGLSPVEAVAFAARQADRVAEDPLMREQILSQIRNEEEGSKVLRFAPED